jgi:hypothetical protein
MLISIDQTLRLSLFQQRHSDYLGTRKDETSITKINCLGQTVRNFITVVGKHTPL